MPFRSMGADMRRREFITLLARRGGDLATCGRRAQQPDRVRRIGVLIALAESDPEHKPVPRRSGMGSRSWAGRRATTSASTIGGPLMPYHLQTYAAELVGLTTSIPRRLFRDFGGTKAGDWHHTDQIAQVADPVRQGFVASLARPGGNITGFASTERPLKRLELLKELVPTVIGVGPLQSGETQWAVYVREIEAKAPSLASSSPPFASADGDIDAPSKLSRAGRAVA